MSNKFKLQSTSAFLLASLVTTAIAPFTLQKGAMAQTTFADVQGTWAQSCITELTQRNIISGYPDGTFRPNNPVTRAEYASMVGKAFPNAARVRSAVRFVDVPSSYWAFNAITFASQTGFLSGYPGNVFNPSQSIPRAQVLVSLSSGLNFTPSQPVASTLGLFADASAIPGYAQTGIAAATERRLVVNYPNVQQLNPNQLATRAEVASFLCQALTETGQLAAVVPTQYVVGGAPVAQQSGQVTAGTTIAVTYPAASKIVLKPDETVNVTLSVAADVRNNQGQVAIPAGSQIIGQLVPANGGSQFVAQTVVINGQQRSLSASSGVIRSTQVSRDVNLTKTLGGAALSAGIAAIIGGTSGDHLHDAGNLILASSLGAAVGANQGRNVGSAIRDAAIGAALGVGASVITGDRTVTPKKVATGAALGSAVGGVLDRGTTGEIVTINPATDLTLTVNNNVTLP